jgi:acetyltransferase
MASKGIGSILNPQSVAVVGASKDPSRIGGRPLNCLRQYGYRGPVYPVNPKYEELYGWRCYSSVGEIEGPIDLAAIAVGREMVPDVLRACAEKGAKAAVIFSSGFAESGSAGDRLQAELEKVVDAYGIRVVGPNSQGVANLEAASMVSFGTPFAGGDTLCLGHSAIVSQSGALASMIYNVGKRLGKGAKYWIATGNEVDIHALEVVDALLDDDGIRVIRLYFEQIRDGRLLTQVARKALTLEKPILAVKSGRSEEGRQAASSHTGALAADDAVVDAVLRRYGVVRLDNINELGLFPQLFELQKPPSGGRVAVLTNSGGLGVMMVDQCTDYGLEMAALNAESKRRLEELLPAFASAANPLDVTAQLLNDSHLLHHALPILLDDPGVDIVVLALGTVGEGYDIPRLVADAAEAQRSRDGVIAVAWVGSDPGAVTDFVRQGVPVFEDPVLCVKALSLYVEYKQFAARAQQTESTAAPAAPLPAPSAGRSGLLSAQESDRLLSEQGLPVCRARLCRSASETGRIAGEMGLPVALKISAAAIAHKTETGGVVLNVDSREAAEAAYERIITACRQHVPADDIEGVLVQEMVSEPGFEFSVGLRRTEAFGPVIMVASGGIYVEVLKDFRLLVPPLTPDSVREAVLSLRMAPVLQGARGKAALDVNAFVQTVLDFAELILRADWIAEADLNPVIALEQGRGVKIVDSMIRVDTG